MIQFFYTENTGFAVFFLAFGTTYTQYKNGKLSLTRSSRFGETAIHSITTFHADVIDIHNL